MHRMGMLAMAVVSVALLSSCTRGPFAFSLPVTPVQPPPGLIYEEVSAPLSYNFNETPAQPEKTGISEPVNYIGIPFLPYLSIAWGNASLENAQKAGGIDEVLYADYEILHVLGVFSQFKVIAHGR